MRRAVRLREATRALLAEAGVRPRRRLGQHFLVDTSIIARIADLAQVSAEDVVVEIGAGTGSLSQALAGRAGLLYLIEVDRALATALRQRFRDRPTVHVVAADALRLDLAAVIGTRRAKVVANLPYSAATPILFRLLAWAGQITEATVMLQREVAARIRAAPGTAAYGALTVSLGLFVEVGAGFVVPPRAFHPRPRVVSEVMRLHLRARPRYEVAAPELFAAVVRAAFGQRRKMLANALRSLCASRAVAARVVLGEAGIDPRRRGETLSLAEFVTVANRLADAARRRPSSG